MKAKKRLVRALTMGLLLFVCLISIFPFFWMISISIKPTSEVFTYNPTLLPKVPTIQGFVEILTTKSSTVDFMGWVKNSLFCATLTCILGLAVAVFGAYGLSRFRFKGRAALGHIVLIAQVLPGSLLIVPMFMGLSKLNLINTFFGLIIMYITFAVPFCTWMMKGFFDSIPLSLDEAARIDGAGEFALFWRVVTPLTLPGLAVTAFFSFVTGWNEYMFASILMRDYSKWTLPVGLSSFQGQYTTNWTVIMAGSVIVTIPIVILFLALQKHLVGGMTAGAVKQ